MTSVSVLCVRDLFALPPSLLPLSPANQHRLLHLWPCVYWSVQTRAWLSTKIQFLGVSFWPLVFSEARRNNLERLKIKVTLVSNEHLITRASFFLNNTIDSSDGSKAHSATVNSIWEKWHLSASILLMNKNDINALK